MKMIDYIDNPARLSDLVALYVNLPTTDLQELLETVDPLERLKKVICIYQRSAAYADPE